VYKCIYWIERIFSTFRMSCFVFTISYHMSCK